MRSNSKSREMKRRSSSRDSPPLRSKRSRSSIGRYEGSSDERVTPDRLRRRSRVRSRTPRRYISPPSHRDRDRERERDRDRSDYSRSRDVDRSYPNYKVLCVSALHPKASDDVIKETLYREYKKFGDLTIRISHELDDRVAYVCFRNSEDARDAKRSKPRIILFDKSALVEPVYESRSSEYHPRSRTRSRSITPDIHHYYRSPEHRNPPDRYDRMYAPPPMPYRDYRHDVPPIHHDFIRGPPMHHLPPHMPPGPPHHYGPPRHIMHSFRPPPPHLDHKVENKKDKFPNYLHHVPPEDDPLATRTLFAGNLEVNISDEELRRIFGRYGIVEDIDIKRPLPGTGNAYAFVRYQNLDMAHRSKVELSGQYIGKFQCKIGYGKATPTTRIWVGGLGSWTSLSQLEREFDRFGAIKKIDYIKGDTQAYILYDSIDAATAAVKEMRGFPLGGPEHKLRVDFADVNPVPPMKPKPLPGEEIGGDFRARDAYSYMDPHYESWAEGEYYRGYRGRGGGWEGTNRRGGRGAYRGYSDEEWRRSDEYERYKRSSTERSPRARSVDSDDLSSIRNLSDLAKKSSTTWNGALILKNSLFPAKCHLTDGDAEIIDILMKDEENKPLLRITQRLRLDQPKLDDVSKRISGSSSHAIFLGLTGSNTVSSVSTDTTVQTRPLRNLVSYLKQKEAAGVISLVNKDTEVTGVLYAFPPCQFSADLLKRTAHGLSQEALKDDHLVIVVVRGGTA
ncbi:putative RNA-binding protein 15 [Cimex lectularius]|uniref:RNA-binding protein spenito n=1 Tax=Cimex lectularius TaxID=79782 RepID=A0A8I6RG62_CIMLE|nr:putative RNA-binding protein 15 [Cimex lectularius]